MKKLNLNISAHQFFNNILKEYYPTIVPEYTDSYANLDEVQNLYELIIRKYQSPIYTNFLKIKAILQYKFSETIFFMQENDFPSLTLVFKLNKDDVKYDIYFSISMLCQCYTLFIKCPNHYGFNYYFVPAHSVSELYEEIDQIILSELSALGFFQIPHIWLSYKIKQVIPGVNETSKEDGQIIGEARIFDALFFKYDFRRDGDSVIGGFDGMYDFFKKVDFYDGKVSSVFHFFTRKKETKLVEMGI